MCSRAMLKNHDVFSTGAWGRVDFTRVLVSVNGIHTLDTVNLSNYWVLAAHIVRLGHRLRYSLEMLRSSTKWKRMPCCSIMH